MTVEAGRSIGVGEPDLVVLDTPKAATTFAAERVATILAEAVQARGRADWATTGGSIVPGLYRALAHPGFAAAVPWSAVHVWWGDDRCVPPDDPLCNVRPLEDVLLRSGAIPLPSANLHPFPIDAANADGLSAARAAAQIAADLRVADLVTVDGWPVFDLILLGVGVDGHVLSVFPGSSAFESTDWALPIPAPTHIAPHVERMTLNPAILGVARSLLVVATGAAKATILADVLGGAHDPRRWPAQLARRPGATWIFDEAAAADLPPRVRQRDLLDAPGADPTRRTVSSLPD